MNTWNRFWYWWGYNSNLWYLGMSLFCTASGVWLQVWFLSGFTAGMSVHFFQAWLQQRLDYARLEMNRLGVHYYDHQRWRLTPDDNE